MHLPAKITMNCFYHISMKSLTSIVFRCCLQIPLKRHFSSTQNLLQSSKIISYCGQHSFLGNRYAAVSTRNQHAFSQMRSIASKTETQRNILALQAKKRVPRKKSTFDLEQVGKDKWLVVAYSSAEEYDLSAAAKEVEKQGVYKILPFPEDASGEVLHVSANYKVGKEPRHIYFFSEGSVVFWNVPDLEQQSVLDFLKPFQVNSYDDNLVKQEKEDLEYLYGENGTKLLKGVIILNEERAIENFETYAFSNGMALSVKLAMWEATLESFVDSIEWVAENMKYGKEVKMSSKQLFQMRGELFALRHVINLSSDLLDTPDFYWDRDDLEILYRQIYNHLTIAKRTKVMNERLNYCSELMDLLVNHINDKHHVRLEQMIIALIMVEVLFECAHFIMKVFQE